VNLPKSNKLSEIGKHLVEKYFQFISPSTSHHPVYFTSKGSTLPPLHLYQKDERTLPGETSEEDILFPIPVTMMNVLPLATPAPVFYLPPSSLVFKGYSQINGQKKILKQATMRFGLLGRYNSSVS
jgi:hypothetical protein